MVFFEPRVNRPVIDDRRYLTPITLSECDHYGKKVGLAINAGRLAMDTADSDTRPVSWIVG